MRVGKIYTLSLQLTWVPDALNKTLRKNRHANNRSNHAWDCYVGAYVVGKKPAAPLQRAKITIVRHSHRMLDFDGLAGSLKPVVDALVSCGILVDDSWKVTGPWHLDQVFRPKKLGAMLEVRVDERAAP